MTSRRVFRNVLYSVEGQDGDGVLAAADGTYKLHFGGWVLVALGTYRSRYVDYQYRKSFLPWAYMFVRTEHKLAYEALFTTVVEFTALFFKRTLKVQFGSLDHSACIANAFKSVWPEIKLLDCYPHVARKCREKIGLLKPCDNPQKEFDGNIQVNITQLHKTRSPEQFAAVSAMCLKHWRSEGHTAYADWFTKIYLEDDWTRWYATSGIPGVVPSQNPLESHNRVIKTCGVTAKRAKTGMVLNDSIPGVLNLVCDDAATEPVGHYCEGPIPSSIVHRAGEHLHKGCFYKKREAINRKKPVTSIFFNASVYMQSDKGPAVEVTKARVDMYQASKKGKLQGSDTVRDINLHYLSLHEVKILDHSIGAVGFTLTLEPNIAIAKIRDIRALYECDCKKFWSNGWICSHVVAAMSINGQFDLNVAKENLPTTKLSGGQRKIPGALYVDAPDSRTFAVPALIKRLLKHPHYPHGWKIAKEMTVNVNGAEADLFMVGKIQSYSLNGGIYKWLVAFEDGIKQFFECEELAELIVASRQSGLDVTCSAESRDKNPDMNGTD